MLLLTLLGCPHLSTLEDAANKPVPTVLASYDPLEEVSIPDLPLWTNKYAPTREDYGHFFNISALMGQHQLSRLQAVELQNHYRDLHRAEPDAPPELQFELALKRVQEREFESGLDEERLEMAPFIVVFDLDETLYDQYYSDELAVDCHTVRWERESGPKAIHMVPGWESTLGAIRELGGEIVLFSANLDEPTRENLEHILWGDTPLLGHPDIAGVMTNSYLIMQEKSEGAGAENARRGRPIAEPSKDLRFFDETLSKVIIVDDNPTRLFQMANARVFRKFHADEYCDPELEDPQKAAFEYAMPTVEVEIREAVRTMGEYELDFQTGYLPYTSLGRVAVEALRTGDDKGYGDPYVAAIALRLNPHWADTKY